jgi:hypothetical protein
MRVLARLGIAPFVVLALLPVSAQETPEKYLELLRTDVRSQKVAVLTEALDLPQAQADVFWPIYREYDKELQGLGDRRVTLVKRFAEKYGTLTDADADGFVKEWFDLQNDRTKLRQKYYGKISKATSSLVAARFLQVENTLEMLIDLNIAAELPLLK